MGKLCLEISKKARNSTKTGLASYLLDGVVYRISRECGNVAKTGGPMQDRIKEHDRDLRLARIQIYAVSEHAHNTGH